MKWEYICDVITNEQYHEIATQFAGKEVTESKVRRILLKINPNLKKDLGDDYSNFILTLVNRIYEEPYTGLENGILYNEDEE